MKVKGFQVSTDIHQNPLVDVPKNIGDPSQLGLQSVTIQLFSTFVKTYTPVVVYEHYGFEQLKKRRRV